MENHPIPQDVTGFKFKLIGSITLKQFLYLLFFGIFCVISFIMPVSPLIKIPFMFFFGALGAALAFVPIEGRPLDVMLVHFLKALPSENRYIYHKKGANFFAYEYLKASAHSHTKSLESDTTEQQRKSMLMSQLRNSSYRPDQQEIDFMKNIKSFFEETAYTKSTTTTPIAPVAPLPPQPAPAPVVVQQVSPKASQPSDYAKSLGEQALALQRQIEKTELQEKTSQNQSELEHQINDLQSQLNRILSQRDLLEKKMLEYEKESVKKDVYTPSAQKVDEAPQEKITQSARIVSTKESQLKAGFPSLPDIGNIVLGIVKDPREKVLQNILVEVVDKNEIPVRAFKTNALGQFAAATQLPNGTYKVFFEDPKKEHEFDTIEITLNGDIFQPLEVFSVDQREKLRRELFQN